MNSVFTQLSVKVGRLRRSWRKHGLVAILLGLLSWPLNAVEASNEARGGNTPTTERLLEQFNQVVVNGDPRLIQLASDRLIQFATQPVRADDERLALFLALTEQAMADDSVTDFFAIIAKALSFQAEFGHFLALHHFHFEDARPQVVNSLIWLAQNASSRLDEIRVRFIWRVYRYIKEQDPIKSAQLLEELFNAGFPRAYSANAMDSLYFDLILASLESTNPKSLNSEQSIAEPSNAGSVKVSLATKIFKDSIHDLTVKLHIWHDNRFQLLWPLLDKDGPFDPVRSVEVELNYTNQFLQSEEEKTWNKWLDTQAKIVNLNRSIGRFEKAIEVAQAAIEVVPEEIRVEDSFFWLQMELVYAHNERGDSAAAYELMETILKLPVAEHPVLVSGHINYAIILLDNQNLAKAELVAQKIIKDYSEYTNRYGEYYAQSVLACVWYKTGKRREANALLREMLAEAQENYYATTRAALCLQDRATVTELYLKRLDDPHQRAETLSYLSEYRLSRGDIKNRTQEALRDSIIESPAIQKAIRQYGRTSHWQLPATYWDGL